MDGRITTNSKGNDVDNTVFHTSTGLVVFTASADNGSIDGRCPGVL